MKFLLLEDDPNFAESVRQLLETHYYSVDLAADGSLGLEIADIFSYDLILLDWMLPKQTGIQVCQKLRERGDRTRIILMTAQDDKTEQKNSISCPRAHRNRLPERRSRPKLTPWLAR